MSRSWERMVRKNTQAVNRARKKQGKGTITAATKSEFDKFLGRSIILPTVLIGFALMYAVMTAGVTPETSSTLYWVTIGLYILLGVTFIFRRPYLAVGKSSVMTRRLNRDRRLEAGQIKQITVQKGYVVIEPSIKGSAWVFSRLTNRYDTQAMAERLEEFAKVNNVPFENKEKREDQAEVKE